MFYKLLGMAVWKALKLFLRRRYGRTYLPRPLLAGVGLLLVGAIVAVVARRETS
jgi:uncharacterized membrane protein YidH (DUF202 family)